MTVVWRGRDDVKPFQGARLQFIEVMKLPLLQVVSIGLRKTKTAGNVQCISGSCTLSIVVQIVQKVQGNSKPEILLTDHREVTDNSLPCRCQLHV